MTAPVKRPTLPNTLGNHEERIRRLEFAGERWIYVGTVGNGDVPDDDLLSPDSPPFQNSWTNLQDGYQLASFVMRDNTWVHLRGGVGGGSAGSVVFTLPEDYRPTATEVYVGALAVGGGVATIQVETTGDVTILTIDTF